MLMIIMNVGLNYDRGPPPPGYYEEENRLGDLMTKINTLELALREQDITINELEVKLKIATMDNKSKS